MIARVVKTGTTLDYTGLTRPLTVDIVSSDLRQLEEKFTVADRITMWEYQWDWITKPYREKPQQWQNLFAVKGLQYGKNTLIGIPVEFA